MAKAQLLPFSLSMALLFGCSGKPDISVIEADLVDAWSQCKGLKVSGLKKTNGVKDGDGYSMNFSYNLELLADNASLACEGNDQNVVKLANVMLANNKDPKEIKKGDIITVNGAVNLVKTEKGWAVQ
jgi:hypothetical protein